MNENNELENAEKLDNIIILNDEEGKEVKFEFVDLIEYENEEYIIVKQDDILAIVE